MTISLDPGFSISYLNNREKTKIADTLRQTYPLTELLHVLSLARSSYFYHRVALEVGDKYATILTDITEFLIPAGKVWLSPVVDCFDGKVVSWSLSTRPDAELVNTMLDNAVETLNAGERSVIHSDRGGHYR